MIFLKNRNPNLNDIRLDDYYDDLDYKYTSTIERFINVITIEIENYLKLCNIGVKIQISEGFFAFNFKKIMFITGFSSMKTDLFEIMKNLSKLYYHSNIRIKNNMKLNTIESSVQDIDNFITQLTNLKDMFSKK